MLDGTRKARLIMDLRRLGVTDTGVVRAMEAVPRDLFVADAFKDQAWEDRALPAGSGQTISQISVVAFMTQALNLSDRMKVLEIGTGTGYQTAVLARLARRVYSIERHKPLLTEAEARLSDLRLRNVTLRHGDGRKGWPELAPFERIMVTAAAPRAPSELIDQLAEDGVMVVPIGPEGAAQDLVRIVRRKVGYDETRLLGVRFVPLVGGLPDTRSSG